MAASRFLSGKGEAARAEPVQARTRTKAAAGAAGDVGLSDRFMESFSGRLMEAGLGGRVGSGSSRAPGPSGDDSSSIRRSHPGEKGRQGGRPGRGGSRVPLRGVFAV